MPKKYDAATRWLIGEHPMDWLRLIGAIADEVEVVDADLLDTDLSTVTSAADGVFRVRRPTESLHHVELETGHHGSEKPADLLQFNVLATRKYRLPTETTLVLFKREADSPALTGRLEYRRPDGTPYLRFEYNVLRVWQIPVEALLDGGIGTLPLAPIAKVTQRQLPGVISRMKARLEAEAGQSIGDVWAATEVLMGLRYTNALTERLLQGVSGMKESVTYQKIFHDGEVRGRVEGQHAMLVNIGENRFGTPSPQVVARIAAIFSADQLAALAKRVWAVETWDELLADVN